MEELPEEGVVKGQSRAGSPRSTHATRNVYSQLSGLEDVVLNDFMTRGAPTYGPMDLCLGGFTQPDDFYASATFRDVGGQTREIKPRD